MHPTADPVPARSNPVRSGVLERTVALVLRSLHLLAVVWLGAALLGAPVSAAMAGSALLASGTFLLVLDLRARRLRLAELAGAVVLVKLGAAALMVWQSAWAPGLFWAVAFTSALAAHAPKHVRHWPRA